MDVKQHWTIHIHQSSGVVWKSRWTSWTLIVLKYGLCGRKATLNYPYSSELGSCVKVEVDILNSPSLIVLINMVSVDVKQQWTIRVSNDVVDYIEHFFFDCPKIFFFGNYIEQYILITFDIQTHQVTVVDVLFGIKQHNYGKVKTKRINHVILIAKMCISMYKKTTLTPSFHCPWYLKISSGSEMFNNYCEKLKKENCAHCNQGEEA